MKPSTLSPINDAALRESLKGSPRPMLVSFWAPWNSSSAMLESTLSELAYDYQRRLEVRAMNVDENAHSPAIYGIESVPHMVLFKNGEVVASFSAAQPKAKLMEILDSHLS